jgi:hypothetical protein
MIIHKLLLDPSLVEGINNNLIQAFASFIFKHCPKGIMGFHDTYRLD